MAMAPRSDAAPAPAPGSRLDEASFRHFAPLLRASQDYAGHSGCRFRSSSFDGIDADGHVSEARARDGGPRLAAKLRAAPEVAAFRARLQAPGAAPELAEEVDKAFRIVMSESVRNAMLGMFKALDMFPPSPAPPGVADDDCSYEDTSAYLPTVAQRLYNDQARRVMQCSADGIGQLDRRAITAAFLVDFAEGAGMEMPPVPETQQSMLRELSERVAEESQRRGDDGQVSRARQMLLSGLGVGRAADDLRQVATKFLDNNWKTMAFVAGAAAVAGTIAAAVLASGRPRGREHQEF